MLQYFTSTLILEATKRPKSHIDYLIVFLCNHLKYSKGINRLQKNAVPYNQLTISASHVIRMLCEYFWHDGYFNCNAALGKDNMGAQISTVRHKIAKKWRHNEHDGVSDHQSHDCLLNRLFRRRSEKTSQIRVTGLCVGNSPATVEFPAQMASNAENISIWWRHHG